MNFKSFQVNSKAIKQASPKEWCVRFLFGGLVSIATALVSKKFGPAVGGLFLAFPSIMPATITLVEKHSGRADAIRECFGTLLGSLGLFGGSVEGDR